VRPEFVRSTLSEVASRAAQIARSRPAIAWSTRKHPGVRRAGVNVPRTVQSSKRRSWAPEMHNRQTMVNPKRCGQLDGKDVRGDPRQRKPRWESIKAARRRAPRNPAFASIQCPKTATRRRPPVAGMDEAKSTRARSKCGPTSAPDLIFSPKPMAQRKLDFEGSAAPAIDVRFLAQQTEIREKPAAGRHNAADLGVNGGHLPRHLRRLLMHAGPKAAWIALT